jgi:hypothetical protein
MDSTNNSLPTSSKQHKQFTYFIQAAQTVYLLHPTSTNSVPTSSKQLSSHGMNLSTVRGEPAGNSLISLVLWRWQDRLQEQRETSGGRRRR